MAVIYCNRRTQNKSAKGRGTGGSLEDARHRLPGVSPGVHTVDTCAQLYLTLCDPRDCSLPGSLVRGISPGKDAEVGGHCFLHSSHRTHLIPPAVSSGNSPKCRLPLTRYPEFLLGADHVDTLCLKVKVTQSCLTLCDPIN